MDQSLFSSFAIVALVAILGAVSPGPDFVIVTKHSLAFSRRTGLYTALGVSLGVFVHIAYCLIGIGFSIAESIFLFNCIKYCGAAYLIYIGLKSLLAKATPALKMNYEHINHDLTPFQALKTGFLANVLNPKATMFFLSVFSQVISPDTKLIIQLAYALEIWLIILGWFCLLAFILSNRKLRSRIVHLQHYFEKGMGVLLVAFGLKIAFI
ncbi:MAG: LysE family transporter [Parachlamydiaceae bacterium]|nr:LysE family transporter [Parachlamydiaceae bacterium]